MTKEIYIVVFCKVIVVLFTDKGISEKKLDVVTADWSKECREC